MKPAGVVQIFERIMRDAQGAPEYHYVLIDYFCRVTGGTLAAASDVSARRMGAAAALLATTSSRRARCR